MILSARQPAYLPWLGYFDKIARADVFVYLDTVQFEKNSFINRNKIKTPNGASWLTIPVKTKGHMRGSLRTTQIDDSQPWRARHLKSIRANCGKAPRFEECFAKMQALLATRESNLAEFCLHQLRFWLDELGIDTRVVRSSELTISSSKSQLALDLCHQLGAQRYLSGMLGRDYLVEADFVKAGIELEYQRYDSMVYPQLWGEFIPDLCVLDWWMNMSDQSALRENS
jgi:WbqC-like protein family